jgi:hypothetical protein
MLWRNAPQQIEVSSRIEDIQVYPRTVGDVITPKFRASPLFEKGQLAYLANTLQRGRKGVTYRPPFRVKGIGLVEKAFDVARTRLMKPLEARQELLPFITV